jgi:hypothetical protein
MLVSPANNTKSFAWASKALSLSLLQQCRPTPGRTIVWKVGHNYEDIALQGLKQSRCHLNDGGTPDGTNCFHIPLQSMLHYEFHCMGSKSCPVPKACGQGVGQDRRGDVRYGFLNIGLEDKHRSPIFRVEVGAVGHYLCVDTGLACASSITYDEVQR